MNEPTDKEDPEFHKYLPHHQHTAMVRNPNPHKNNYSVVVFVHYMVDLPQTRADRMGVHIHNWDHIQLELMQHKSGTHRLKCVFLYLLDILI